MSIALFAPGWVLENNEMTYIDTKQAFWSRIEALLLPRAIQGLPLLTNFSQGHGAAFAEQGKFVARQPQFHFSTQDLLPNIPINHANPFFPGEDMKECFTDVAQAITGAAAYSGYSCLRLSGTALPSAFRDQPPALCVHNLQDFEGLPSVAATGFGAKPTGLR
jgi:endo-beta-N-acetylglucosaminidase D